MVMEFECNECHNKDFEYKDFTAKSVKICTQCKTEFYEEDGTF
jgi:hypothetical protein